MKLKPCPFCGSRPLTRVRNVQLAVDYRSPPTCKVTRIIYDVTLFCPDCLIAKAKRNVMATGTSVYEINSIEIAPFEIKDGLVEAAEAWNRRI